MKITYEFDTDTDSWVDDRYRLEKIERSDDMALALWDISQKIRDWYKRDTRPGIPVEELSDEFYKILDNYNINLDKLIY